MNVTDHAGPSITRHRTIAGLQAIADFCGPGISIHRVRDAVNDGSLPKLANTGRTTVVLTEDVEGWLRSLRTVQAAS
jgi:hypothetical protein